MLTRSAELLDIEPFTNIEASEILQLCGIEIHPTLIGESRIYPELLPIGAEIDPYTEKQRLIHLIWHTFNKAPLSELIDFAIPLRRMLAKHLFKKCGKNFTALGNITFNYGHHIEVGDDVFIQEQVYIDSKGGVSIGNSSCLAEYVHIYTHKHGEAIHSERIYTPVVIDNYVKVYEAATILGGVHLKEQCIVAAKSLVAHDVEENILVGGIPAKPLRPRDNQGLSGKGLDHRWLYNGIYQDEE